METFFTKDHEWITIDGNTGTVGITAYAAKQLGDITFVEPPKTGKTVKKGDVLCAIESVKAASDIFTPVSGRVLECNPRLDAEPGLVNESPEQDGWIAKMEISDRTEASGLMNRTDYQKLVS